MTVVGNNSLAVRVKNFAMSTDRSLGSAMSKLATGNRINSARDDAANIGIAQSMTAQIRGMGQAMRNVNDGVALTQTADGALANVVNALQRIRELAVQASSGTYSDQQRTGMQSEISQLSSQVSDILTNTEFNGIKLFDASNGGSGTSFAIQTGASSSNTITVSIGNIDASSINASPTDTLVTVPPGDPSIGSTHWYSQADWDHNNQFPQHGSPNWTAADIGVSGVFLMAGDQYWTRSGGFSISDQSSASSAITAADNMIGTINSARAGLGAAQSRLQSAASTLSSSMVNMTDARSQIQDTDFASETRMLARDQMLNQASNALLAQANQNQQTVLQLLR